VKFLRHNGFNAAPVLDQDGNLVGVVDRSALVAPSRRRTPGQARRGLSWLTAPVTVRDLMSTPVESMTPGADLAHVVALMPDKHLEWVPIVDGHTVVGVITPSDLAQASHPPAATAW